MAAQHEEADEDGGDGDEGGGSGAERGGAAASSDAAAQLAAQCQRWQLQRRAVLSEASSSAATARGVLWYMATRDEAAAAAALCRACGLRAVDYNADLPDGERREIEAAWLRSSLGAVCATRDSFGLGLDKANVPLVILARRWQTPLQQSWFASPRNMNQHAHKCTDPTFRRTKRIGGEPCTPLECLVGLASCRPKSNFQGVPRQICMLDCPKSWSGLLALGLAHLLSAWLDLHRAARSQISKAYQGKFACSTAPSPGRGCSPWGPPACCAQHLFLVHCLEVYMAEADARGVLELVRPFFQSFSRGEGQVFFNESSSTSFPMQNFLAQVDDR